MPTVPIYPSLTATTKNKNTEQEEQHGSSNPLPEIIQTPSGLAILEIQGTLNIPEQSEDYDKSTALLESGAGDNEQPQSEYDTPIGRLVFPDYDPSDKNHDWMKRVHLYIGRHQRLTGEVKKLPRPLALIQRQQEDSQGKGSEQSRDNDTRPPPEASAAVPLENGEEDQEALEIVELVKYKLLFSSRPEPVSDIK